MKKAKKYFAPEFTPGDTVVSIVAAVTIVVCAVVVAQTGRIV